MAYIGKTRDYLLHLNVGEEVFRKAHELKHPMADAEVREHDENRTAELDRLGISTPPLLLEEKGPGVEVVSNAHATEPGVEVVSHAHATEPGVEVVS